ncbi:MAG: TolC family protein, partial [Bdellovibrionales bacterium]|nr:TolC family protein [Bdellovibrionales bacterium]
MTKTGRSRFRSALVGAPLGALAVLLSACDPALPPTCRVPESASEELARARDSGKVILTAENLPGLLFNGSAPIHLAANRVHQAKVQLNQSRAGLLPSLNLSFLLFASGQPQFAWSAIEAVVPFLIPGNWFKASETQKLFEAEKMALQIVEQNQYASSMATISMWAVDQQLLEISEDDLRSAVRRRQRAQQRYDMGLITIDELNQVIVTEQETQVSAAKVREMIAREEAIIRQMLGLEPTVKLSADLAAFLLSDSPTENLLIDEVVDRAMLISPEALQLSRLEEAARTDRWSATFAFMGGASMGLSGNDGKLTPALDQLTGRGGIQLGFGYFPALEMSNLNIREIELRREELRLEFQGMLQGIQAQMISSKVQRERLAERERAQRSRYESMKLKVELGLAEAFDLSPLEDRWLESRLDLLQATADLS